MEITLDTTYNLVFKNIPTPYFTKYPNVLDKNR